MRCRLMVQARDWVEFESLTEALLAARGHLWFIIETLDNDGVWKVVIDREESRGIFR